MATLTIELPEELTAELKDRHISEEIIHTIAVQAIKEWLDKELGTSVATPETANSNSSRFSESAVPYVDKLIDDNHSLFERLAKLPDDA